MHFDKTLLHLEGMLSSPGKSNWLKRQWPVRKKLVELGMDGKPATIWQEQSFILF